MRTIKELLILLDKEIDGIHFRYGLCNLVMQLVSHNIISRDEMRKILDYIHVNHPIAVGMEGSNDEWSIKNLYWWPEGERRPRHKYMKILIENCDENRKRANRKIERKPEDAGCIQ